MISVKISKPAWENSLMEETFVPMELDETKVKYFKVFTMIKGRSKEIRNFIYWQEGYQKITYEDHYDYLKSNLTDFIEYKDKYQNIYLINSKLYAGIEKYDWGIDIRFIDGDGVPLEL